MKKIFFTIGWILLFNIGYGQEIIDVFTINKSDKKTLTLEKDLSSFSILKIENFSNTYAAFKRNKEASFQLNLPISKSENIILELTAHNIYADDFKVIEKSIDGDKVVPFNKPLHFTGTVQGQATSMAGLTVAENQLMGVISYKGNNYNLELYEQNKNTQSYILYRQDDYKHPLDLNCTTDASKSLSLTEEQTVFPNSSSRSRAGPIEVYLECDYQMYLTNNRNRNSTARYTTELFTIVSGLFKRSSINLRISEIGVWTTQDPYGISPSTSGYTVFDNFIARTTSFNGQIAQLLTTSPVTEVGGLGRLGDCSNPTHLNGGLYSLIAALNNSFNSNLAVYSWDVYVMAHELGHNMGSPHTHDCAWNGNNTPIDCCGPSPDGCVCSVGIPRVGTIMSYCNNANGPGIDLLQGFHPQVTRRMQGFAECLAPEGNTRSSYDITLSTSGSGQITITDDQENNQCTSSCTLSYSEGASLALQAQASSGHSFVRWEGDVCNNGTGSCVFNLSQNLSIRAVFEPINTNADCACTNQFDDNICEDFESYRVNQYLGSQSPCWTTWSGRDGNSEDVYVADNGNKYINIYSDNENGGPQDVVLQLGNKTSGIYDLEFYMYIYDGDKGYYNIQHVFDPTQEKHEWASNVYFEGNGNGSIEIKGNKQSFSYPTNKWFSIKQRIDLNQDYSAYYIDQNLVTTWRFSDQATATTKGVKQLSAIDFYPSDNTHRFFIDAISLTKIRGFSKEDTGQLIALISDNSSEETSSTSINIFPNPANQVLNISLDGFEGETIKINLINMLGQTVYKQQLATTNDVLQIDISQLPVGTYLVSAIDTNGEIATKKAVKMAMK